MGQINDAIGIGKKYVIDGQSYEVIPATIEEIEQVAELYGKTRTGVLYNFLDPEESTKEAFFQVLEACFGGKVPREKLKKLRRDQAEEAVKFFLVG